MNTINDPLNEREFELVNIVGAQLAASQRELSRQMNLSLGMTNMILKRLVTKGYIRIKQLDKRKVEYLLTPKGFTEKMRKSVRYTIKTINSIGLINRRISFIFQNLIKQGHKKFYVLGKSDLAGLVINVLNEQLKNNYELVYIDQITTLFEDGIILICTEQAICPVDSNGKCINLIEELAKDEALVG